MRDMGTEMTPIPSQEPSRSATPVGATTPLLSPNSSIPSTPRRGPEPSSKGNFVDHKKDKLSEKEMKHKTRREIVALGVQLGKMNIAAWAIDDDKEKGVSGNKTIESNEFERVEYAKRVALWEEAEKFKHAARFKQEEIKIQAWETRQKAKLDAEMRRIEILNGFRAKIPTSVSNMVAPSFTLVLVQDLKRKPKYLVTFTVGLNQMNNIDAAVKKFSEDFHILLFHYDGHTSEWDQFEWSRDAIHVSVRKQTKW